MAGQTCNNRETVESARQNHNRQYLWIVVSVTFAAFMSKLDSYIVNISLPTIARYFHADTGEVSRTILVYMLVTTSTLLFFGKLADRVGLRKIFIAGYGVFVAGSFLCGISWSIDALVFFRFVQGIGGAMILAAAFAIISKFLPHEIIGWAFGIASTGAALGIAFGAPLGGFINNYLSWHWIFLVNVPVGLFAIVTALKVLPGEEKAALQFENGKWHEFDIPGTLLSFGGLSFLFYAINKGGDHGWNSPTTMIIGGIAAVLLIAFLVWEQKNPTPLLDFHLFRNNRFVYANIAMFFGFMLLAGNTFLLPFYLELAKGLNTLLVGLVITIYSVVYIVFGPLGGRLSDRVKPAYLCAGAMLSASVCSYLFSRSLAGNGLVPVIIFLVWLACSYGIFISPSNNLVMSLAPADKQGIASGLFNTFNSFGIALGVALFEAVFSRSPVQQANAGTLEGVVREANTVGFQNAYMFGSAVCLVSFVFSLLGARNSGGHGDFRKGL